MGREKVVRGGRIGRKKAVRSVGAWRRLRRLGMGRVRGGVGREKAVRGGVWEDYMNVWHCPREKRRETRSV